MQVSNTKKEDSNKRERERDLNDTDEEGDLLEDEEVRLSRVIYKRKTSS